MAARLKPLLKSLGDYEVAPEAQAAEPYLVTCDIRLTCELVSARQSEKPETGTRFALVKPRTVQEGLRKARAACRREPLEVIAQVAPAWLRRPHLDAERVAWSEILGYRTGTERVVDRVEARPCRSCRGKGEITVRRRPQKMPCLACGGAGGRDVTKIHSAPGTTTHGMPYTERQYCGSCGGSGYVRTSDPGPAVQTERCARCGGSGRLERKYYKKATYYETWRVRTKLSVSGKEKAPRLLRELRRKTGSRALTPENLAACATGEVRQKSVRAGRVALRFELSLPFSVWSVMDAGRKRGLLYALPADGSLFAAAESPFLDGALKGKIRELSRMDHKEVEHRRASDYLLALLVRAASEEDGKVDPGAVAWLMSEKVLARGVGATRRAMRRGKGLLARLRGK